VITVHRLTPLALLVLATGWAAPRVLPAQARDGVPMVTLTEARRLAAAVDPAAVAARAEVGTAAWERRSAVADLLTPNVAAATTYTRYNDPFFSFTGSPSVSTATAVLEARYTLLGAGKLAELRRSNASVATADANATASRFRTALATDAAYYIVLAEGELSRAAADRLRRATEQLSVARVRVQAGDAITTDSLQLLLEVTRARLEVLRRDSALVVSRLRLGRQIGLSGPADAEPLDTATPPPLPLTLEAASAELRARGPELQALRAVERQAAAVVSAHREDYLPDVTLSAAVAAYDSDFFPSFLKRSSIALTVSLPIWDGGRRELAFARAQGQRDVARALREERERATAERMAQAYNGYETGRAGIELAQIGVSAATENYRVQGARYREGATTIVELLEAQEGLTEADATLVQARYAARLALAQIEALLGRRLLDN
jgi:outer membrane protein